MTARERVEAALAVVDAREAELHAFNTVLRDEALAQDAETPDPDAN